MNGCTLSFDSGTIIAKGDSESVAEISSLLKHDTRVGEYRAQAYQYAVIMRKLYAAGIPVTDRVKNYDSMPELTLHTDFSPMPHQAEAMKAWKQAKCRGVVVLPTGSGKTFFAVLAINMLKRPTLVVVPTIDLMQQWASVLEKFFQCKVGMLGGGSKEILPITVSTYDSAVLQMEFIGNQFGLAVYDECHHLPGQVNRTAASMCIAPYRLGLTATPERDDDGESVMRELIGNVVFYAHIDELEGDVL